MLFNIESDHNWRLNISFLNSTSDVWCQSFLTQSSDDNHHDDKDDDDNHHDRKDDDDNHNDDKDDDDNWYNDGRGRATIGAGALKPKHGLKVKIFIFVHILDQVYAKDKGKYARRERAYKL